MKEDLATNIVNFLESYGINPIYAVTLFCILICVGFYDDIKNFEDRDTGRQILASSAYFGAIVLVIVSLLILFGVL